MQIFEIKIIIKIQLLFGFWANICYIKQQKNIICLYIFLMACYIVSKSLWTQIEYLHKKFLGQIKNKNDGYIAVLLS